jgi:hypothetical protein
MAPIETTTQKLGPKSITSSTKQVVQGDGGSCFCFVSGKGDLTSAASTSGSASSTCDANQTAWNTVIMWISSKENWLPSLEQTLLKPVTTSGIGVLPYQAQGVP